MKYYYTRQRPIHVAGVMTVEFNTFPYITLVVPPNAEEFNITASCPTRCHNEVRSYFEDMKEVALFDFIGFSRRRNHNIFYISSFKHTWLAYGFLNAFHVYDRQGNNSSP